MAMSGPEPRSELVLELAEEFLERYRNGQRPPLREYIERHPDLADEIREVFPAMAMMERIAIADESLDGDPTGAAPVRRGRAPEQLGDYRILREIGRGGMGVVYEAEQVSLGRHVALKVLPAEMVGDEKTRRRFEREAKAAAKLHHTNIVPVFGVGGDGDTPYYVMQFIRGQGLDAVLEELKRLRADDGGRVAAPVAAETSGERDLTAADVARSLLTAQHISGQSGPNATEPMAERGEDNPSSGRSDTSLSLPGAASRGKSRRESYWQGIARIAHQAADALAYAHDQGIVHRDIKPSNLLLDAAGTVWITDFGLAKANDQQDLTHTGDILGTLRYLPPEAFGGKVDARGDVYSLGLTLYELLAFRPAFDEKERVRLVRQVASEAPPPLRRLNPEVPRDLETIVQKAIERDPAHRYGTASELADDLRRFLDDEPIRARRLSPAERLARWGRRNPAIAGLSAALLLAMAAGTIGSTLFARRAGEQALRATRALAAEAAARGQVESSNASLAAARDDLRVTLYDARMNLAQAAWDADNLDGLANLLDQARPRAGEPDPRGFEWYFWERRARGEARVLPMSDGWPPGRPGSFMASLAPDGATVVAVSEYDRDLWAFDAWHTATGKVRWRTHLPLARADRVGGPRIAFSDDGGRLAVGWKSANAWHAIVLDAATGREESSWSVPYQAPARAPGFFIAPVALSADGRRLALVVGSEMTASSEPTSSRLLVWDVDAKGHAPRMDVKLPDDTIYVEGSIVFTPDGDTLLEAAGTRIGAYEGAVRTWDVARGAVRDTARLPGLRPIGLALRPDGKRALVIGTTSAFENAVAKLLDPADLREVGTFPVAGWGGSTARAYSPDGRRLVFKYSQSPLVRIVDAETGGPLRELKGPRAVVGVQFSRDGRSVLTLDSEQVLRTWDVADLDPARDPSRLDVASVDGAVLSQDATRAVVFDADRGPFDQELTVFDVSSRTPLWHASRRTNRSPDPLVFSADASRLGAWARLGTPLPDPVRSAAGLPRPEEMGGLGISFGRKGDSWVVARIVPGSAAERDGRVRPGDVLLAAGPAEGPQVELSDRPSAVVHRLFSRPVGTPVRLSVRGVASEEPATYVLTTAPLPPDAIAASPERIFLVWDGATGRVLAAVPPGPDREGGMVAAFRPDGREIALGVVETPVSTRYGEPERPLVRVHDATGRWLRDLAYPGDVSQALPRELAYSADGRLLAAAVTWITSAGPRDSSAFVAVWEVATGRLVCELRPPDGHHVCHAVTFRPDGSALAASFGGLSPSSPGRALVWDLPSGAVRLDLGALPHPALGITFTPDGRRLLTLTMGPRTSSVMERELKLWDMTSGRELLTIPCGRLHANPRFTADGRRLIAVGSGSSLLDRGARVVVWDGTEPDGPVTPGLAVSSPRP